VFVFHVINSGLPTFDFLSTGLMRQALETGKFGVELFFGISGIVILPSLHRAPSILVFILDRYARILPVLWATIIAISIFGLFSPRFSQSLFIVALNLMALPPFIEIPQVNPAAWSLGYEFVFYFACAIIVASSNFSRRLALTLLVSSLVFIVYYPRALLMLGGVLVATNCFSSSRLLSLAKYPTVFLVLFLALWRTLEVSSWTNYVGMLTPRFLPFSEWIVILPFILLSGLLGTISLLGISLGHGVLARALSSKMMQRLGTISFSLYLWPPLVMAGIKMFMYRTGTVDFLGPASQIFFLLVTLPPSIAVAALSYNLIELNVTGGIRKRIDKNPLATRRSHPVPPTTDREQKALEQELS
jgi:peptidoglycan/LPS O-acetylase OafA/YrhL